jgi:hypothetical protein
MKQRVLYSVFLPIWLSGQWICLGGIVFALWRLGEKGFTLWRQEWLVLAVMGTFAILGVFSGRRWRKRLLTDPLPEQWTWPYLRWLLVIFAVFYALFLAVIQAIGPPSLSLPGEVTVDAGRLLWLVPGGAIVIVLIGLLASFIMARGQDTT